MYGVVTLAGYGKRHVRMYIVDKPPPNVRSPQESTTVSSTRKLISSSSPPPFHHLDMTLAVAEALNTNKPNQTPGKNHAPTCFFVLLLFSMIKRSDFKRFKSWKSGTKRCNRILQISPLMSVVGKGALHFKIFRRGMPLDPGREGIQIPSYTSLLYRELNTIKCTKLDKTQLGSCMYTFISSNIKGNTWHGQYLKYIFHSAMKLRSVTEMWE